jgi:hypothetical protein
MVSSWAGVTRFDPVQPNFEKKMTFRMILSPSRPIHGRTISFAPRGRIYDVVMPFLYGGCLNDKSGNQSDTWALWQIEREGRKKEI